MEQRITDLLPAPIDPNSGNRIVSADAEINGVTSFGEVVTHRNQVAFYSSANDENYVLDPTDDLRVTNPTQTAAFGLSYSENGFLEGNWTLDAPGYTAFADTNVTSLIRKDYLVSYVASKIPTVVQDLVNNQYQTTDSQLATAGAIQQLVQYNSVSEVNLGLDGALRLSLGPAFLRYEAVGDVNPFILNVLKGVTKQAIRDAVTRNSATWQYGELQGAQPIGSLPGMKFCTQNYAYEFRTGWNDPDGNNMVWVRLRKIT